MAADRQDRAGAGPVCGRSGGPRALDRDAPRSGLKPEADLVRAEALAHLDRAAESEKLLKPLIAGGAEPVASRAALALATLQMEHGDPAAALATLDEALQRFPQSQLVPAFLFRSAESLEHQKRTEEARKRFLKVAETAPHDPWADDAVARAAQLALEAGDHAAALELAGSFAGRFPGSKLEAAGSPHRGPGPAGRRSARRGDQEA